MPKSTQILIVTLAAFLAFAPCSYAKTKKKVKKQKAKIVRPTVIEEPESRLGPAPIEVSPDTMPSSYGLPSLNLQNQTSKTQAQTKSQEKNSKEEKVSAVEFGGALGILANITGAQLEMRFHKPLNMPGISLKTGLLYAQGEDADKVQRKNALVFIDGILEIEPMKKYDLGTYVGGGLNYLAYTTGKLSGTVGAEIYLGVQGKAGKNEIAYAEFGYSAIRTGFSPSYKGLNATIGFRTKL